MKKAYTLRDASEEAMSMPSMNGSMKPEVYCQEVRFDNEMIPEIDKWKVGSTYMLVVEVVMTGNRICYSENEPGEDSEKEATFKITQVGAYSPEVDEYGDVVKEKLKLK